MCPPIIVSLAFLNRLQDRQQGVFRFDAVDRGQGQAQAGVQRGKDLDGKRIVMGQLIAPEQKVLDQIQLVVRDLFDREVIQ